MHLSDKCRVKLVKQFLIIWIIQKCVRMMLICFVMAPCFSTIRIACHLYCVVLDNLHVIMSAQFVAHISVSVIVSVIFLA